MENPPEYYNQSYHNHYVHYKELAEPIEPLEHLLPPLFGTGITYLSRDITDRITPIMGWHPNGEFELQITWGKPGA